jgi:aryl-alcohol dehydrogenase-like predicted oxidoreductase
MKRRKLGKLDVSAIGLGCMSMTPIYGTPDEGEAIATIHEAIDMGIDFIDTSDAYADGKNESLVGRALQDRRDKAIIATKFGNIRYPDGRRDVNGSPEYVRESCENSLKRLGVETIDLYYIHRVDPKTPIEDTVGAMADLKAAGKIRYLGISEASPDTLRRAHATYPMTALQTEYSLWTRDAEDELLDLCAELGIGYAAYAPLGRGFLTGTITALDDLEENDRRRDHPRFHEENMSQNMRLLHALQEGAARENCTPAQLALAWLLARREFVVPLPGTKRRRWLRENAMAVDLTPSVETFAALEKTFQPGVTAGTRYPAGQMKRIGL